jgi:hypothetical protein
LVFQPPFPAKFPSHPPQVVNFDHFRPHPGKSGRAGCPQHAGCGSGWPGGALGTDAPYLRRLKAFSPSVKL